MSITVLLADDHAIVRSGLRALLELQPGIRVIGEAANGREAVRQVEELHPQVAILDIGMPEMNGLEAAGRIGQTCPDTRVIILSMHRTPEHIARALRAGAQGYLLKESAGDELIEAVHAVLRGQRYMSREVTNRIVDDYLRLREGQAVPGPLDSLTSREREVLQMLAEGRSSAEIADLLSLSPRTVDTYRGRIMKKLDIPHLAGLVRFAIRHGLIDLE